MYSGYQVKCKQFVHKTHLIVVVTGGLVVGGREIPWNSSGKEMAGRLRVTSTGMTLAFQKTWIWITLYTIIMVRSLQKWD